MVVFDTETTGLLLPSAAGAEHQPHIVELTALKMNRDFQITDELILRLNPQADIQDEATKVHKITNEDVKYCPTFAKKFYEIASFFLGCTYCIGHNIMFDKTMLYFELMRIDKTLSFPWPPITIDTMEQSKQFNGYHMNLTNLHIKLFGEAFEGAHSAETDTRITAKCFAELCRKEMIRL